MIAKPNKEKTMKKYRICYISRNYYDCNGAGNKAKMDNEDTIAELGGVNLGLPRSIINSKVVAFFLDLAGILKACMLIRRGDIVFLQYPVKKYFAFICRIARMKGARTISVIHDLGSYRAKRLTVEEEIKRLSSCDYIIASNGSMAEWLKANGLKRSIGALGLFDYRSPSMNKNALKERSRYRIVYAGELNMRKNPFLIELSQTDMTWEMYVTGNRKGLPGLQENRNMTYHDFMPSYKFIEEIDADFGLVWDGDSIGTCSGSCGEYLRLNSPHKVSFYLRAGIPVIIWSEAAVAPVVEGYGAGISVGSLAELGHILEELTAEDIRQMKQNAARMAEKLNNGDFLKEALMKAIDSPKGKE